MALRSIETAEISGKRILIRVDFNVEQSSLSNLREHFKMSVAKKTISYLAGQPGTKVALVSHLGDPKGQKNEQYSVKQLIPILESTFERSVTFVPDCQGEVVAKALENLSDGELLLLENPRFYSGEETNDPGFAEALAKPFDVYVNEAFSVCHRAHASVTAITQFKPSFAGFRLLEELENLKKIMETPEHPAIAVIGGAKIETKLPLIQAFEKNYDCVLVGGKIANEALDSGITFSQKVMLPIDFDGPDRKDIGPKTISYFTEILKRAKSVVWNGPLGKFEEKPYDQGTRLVLNAMLESQAFVVIGGGESLTLVEEAGVISKIGFVSTGGGAMLAYLSGAAMPGIVALEQSK